MIDRLAEFGESGRYWMMARPPTRLTENTGSEACHACPSNRSEKSG
jgi:hypothetical protein